MFALRFAESWLKHKIPWQITRSFGCQFGCHTPQVGRRDPIVPAFHHRCGGYGDTTGTVTWVMQLVKNGKWRSKHKWKGLVIKFIFCFLEGLVVVYDWIPHKNDAQCWFKQEVVRLLVMCRVVKCFFKDPIIIISLRIQNALYLDLIIILRR